MGRKQSVRLSHRSLDPGVAKYQEPLYLVYGTYLKTQQVETTVNIRSLTPSTYKENVEMLRRKYAGVDVDKLDTRAIFSELVSAMGGLFGGVWQESADRDWFFFRVRPREDFSGAEDIFVTSQHSYPPLGVCGPGRCNLSGQSMFYSANSWDGAMAEMKRPEVTRYILSLWRLPALPIRYAKFLCGSNVRMGSRHWPAKAFIVRDACAQNGIELTDDLNANRLLAFLESWSDLFLAESNYALSTSISETLFQTEYGGQCDLIAYGSVAHPDGTNFVMPLRVADQLELHRVFDIELLPDGRTEFSGCFEPGESEWRALSLQDAPMPGGDPALAEMFKNAADTERLVSIRP